MKAPPKQRIRHYLLKLTQALLQHLEHFEENTTPEPHFAATAKYTIENACREILQQAGIRKYEYDKSTGKYIDITYFSKSEKEKFKTAQNKIRELEKWITDLRDENQNTRKELASSKYRLTHLEDVLLGKVFNAIDLFERANPAVSIKANLKNLILEETKNVQDLLQWPRKRI